MKSRCVITIWIHTSSKFPLSLSSPCHHHGKGKVDPLGNTITTSSKTAEKLRGQAGWRGREVQPHAGSSAVENPNMELAGFSSSPLALASYYLGPFSLPNMEFSVVKFNYFQQGSKAWPTSLSFVRLVVYRSLKCHF